MYNWISEFNYDFAVATIPIQLILLVFYGIRENLPTKQSYYFWLAMVSNFTMNLTDIVSCELNEIWTVYPLYIIYAINMAYFLSFLIRGWSLFAFTAESTSNYIKKNDIFSIITFLPALAGCILTLSTPFTSAIFTINETGYHNCSLYNIIYFSTYFYIIVSILLVLKSWKSLTGRVRGGLLTFNIILLIGILIRKQFYHTLVTSYFSILAIMVIFLTSENPDLYRDERTKLLNENALNRIGKELSSKHIKYNLMTISINNYESNKIVFGAQQINNELSNIARYLVKKQYKHHLFYIRNGNFVILSKGVLKNSIEQIVDDWKNNYENYRQSEYRSLPLQASMMLLSNSIIRSNDIIVSDIARYGLNNAAIENRKGNYVFTLEMLDNVKKHKAIEKAVKSAITERKFEVYFQPIYSVKHKKVMGAEALARLYDEELGFISPIDFIKLAEKNGDIIEIGKQIFEKVCIFLESVDYEKLGIKFINVNLSPIQCINPGLVNTLSDIAEKHGVPMDIFDFEITESMIEDYEAIQFTIAGLRALGSELSLDDFGTGAANLTSLMNFPIHVVKIDMTFTRSYFQGKAEFLPDLLRLFKHADIAIVVEGIETREMMEKMMILGCDYEQGYYFSKPLPPDSFVEYMKGIK